MLTLTDNAATVIQDITKKSVEAPEGGIRIDTEPTSHSGRLAVELAPAPQPGDAVIEKQGARVFLEREAAATLATMELDVVVKERNIKFTLRERA